ncbi:unnamed protein product [Phytophthora fragariaefolia]|uniref:Unnamed protein product n=1 Tax=Phytophthora fragariaefolia TaxID=1490495 RepID=A0A9W6XTF7_9STRA|nr:unnamed protein product [Phytophthora fragariaefolia]
MLERSVPLLLSDLGGEARLALHAVAARGRLGAAQYLHVRAETSRNDLQRELLTLAQQKTICTLMTNLSSEYSAGGVTKRTMATTAENGILDVVQWLDTISGTTLGMLTYVNTNGKQVSTIDVATSQGHLDVVKDMHTLHVSLDNGTRKRKIAEQRPRSTPRCSRKVMNDAAANCHLKVVTWLHKNSSEGCGTQAMDFAAAHEHFAVTRWLHENRSDGCTVAAMDDAAANGHLSLVFSNMGIGVMFPY